MSYPIRYRGAVIEDVPGAPWTIAYGWRDDVLSFAVLRACPDYASDELRLASWDRLVASVFGMCDLCKATVSIPPEVKTAPSSRCGYVGEDLLVHRDDCPCAVERLEALDRRDSPDGLGTPADMSEESQNVLAEFLNTAVEVLR